MPRARQLGSGSTFWFEVWLGRQGSLEDDVELGSRFTGQRVLLAGSNDRLLAQLKKQLEPEGLVCWVAHDVAEVRNLVEQNGVFDLCLLDSNLGEENLSVMVAFMMAKPGFADTKRIGLVPLIRKKSTLETLGDKAFSAVVVKPLKFSQLTEAIEESLKAPIGGTQDDAPEILPVEPDKLANKSESEDGREIPEDDSDDFVDSLQRNSTETGEPSSLPSLNDIRKIAAKSDGKPKILVVDDNPINRKYAVVSLKQLGYSSETVSDGYSAIEACKNQAFAAILMDCQMPVLDGFQTTKKLRDLDGPASKVPIIAMTASHTADDRKMCINAGMDDFLAKPFKLAELKQMLAEWVTIEGSTSYTISNGAEQWSDWIDFDYDETVDHLITHYLDGANNNIAYLDPATNMNYRIEASDASAEENWTSLSPSFENLFYGMIS